MPPTACRTLLWILCTLVANWASAAPRADGRLRIELVDSETAAPVAGRMHLKTSRGRPVALRLPGIAEYADHFYIDGQFDLPLRAGQYTFELDAGPEYRTQTGHFEIERHADDSKRIEMTRFANLADEGWFAADLDFHREASDMPLILRAEHLHDVRVHEFATLLGLGTEDSGLANRERGLKRRPGPRSTIRSPQRPDIFQIARTPYAWNLPVWLAHGELDAIQLIHHHALRDAVLDNEDDGRPRDRSLFPGAHGNGRWSESVYYHVLNCGLRIPPAAGSGSGRNNSPAGTNRVYAYCGDEFTPENWWEALEAGRVFVTNGPLLRPLVEGHPPGYVFHIDKGESIELEIGLNLATRVPVEYLQIVKDGNVAEEVRLADWAKKKGRLPPVRFESSGWFVVRAVTTNRRLYQFAASGPYYVVRGDQPRISRRSVQFFLDWIADAETRIRRQPSIDETTRDAMLAEHETARRFFAHVLASANAD